MSENSIIWQPSAARIEKSSMYEFMQSCNFDEYDDLYRWSISDIDGFWLALCDFCGVEFSKSPDSVLEQAGDMTTAKWFSGAELNFAAHLLRHEGDRPAIVFRGENGARREVSFDQLRQQVADTAAGLRQAGVHKGDRVAGFLPNCPEAIIAMLATSSIGAVWSSCSPDFGINGVVDRFGQIEPKSSSVRMAISITARQSTVWSLWRESVRRSIPLKRLLSFHLSEAMQTCRLSKTPYRGASSRLAAASCSLNHYRSTTRFTSCIRPAPQACRSASCTVPAERLYSISRN